MGFFDSLASSFVDQAERSVRQKYEAMPLDELKREWEERFLNRDYSEGLPVEKSILGVLDDVYSNRGHYNDCWKARYRRHLREEEERKKKEEQEKEERIKKEEQKRADEQKRKEENEKFEASLPQNEMIKEFISEINNIGFKAYYVEVSDDAIRCVDINDIIVYERFYSHYRYPRLDDVKCSILCNYFMENLNTKYKLCQANVLKLNDPEHMMRSSW